MDIAPSLHEVLLNAYGLSGKTALVTGGTGGIGAAIARILASFGARVVIGSRDGSKATAAATKLTACGLDADGIALDVADESSVEAAIGAVCSRFGRLDILVNNAGVSIRRPSIELPLTDWQKALDTDLTGVFLCARTAARSMIGQNGGQIVNISSISGFAGGRIHPNPAYRAAKAGVINLTRALAVEWACHGIRVNGVAPGWVETEMTSKLMSDAEATSRILGMTPLAKFCTPDDIAHAVAFLVSPAARMVTGHTIAVDGGYLAQ